MESLEARIEGGLASTRKAHQRDACRIDTRMVRQHIEGAIDVEYEIEAAEQGLVGVYLGERTSGEAIECKCRNADFVELSRPHLDVRCHTAGAMLQDHYRQPPRTLREPELSRGRRCLPVGITAQKTGYPKASRCQLNAVRCV